MKSVLAGCVLAAASLGAGWAHAHTDEMLATMKAPHGGQLRMAGPYHLELVVKPGEVKVYVTDHGDTKISTQGARGSVTLLSAKQKAIVKLAPGGDNLMQGKGQFIMGPDMKAVVTVTLPGQPPQHARFTPGKADEHAGHAH
jgi:hypothetical protein